MFNLPVSRLESFPMSLMNKICVQRNGMDDSLFMTATILLYNRVSDLKLTYTMNDNKDVESISLNPEVYSFHWFRNVDSNPDDLLKPIKKNFKTIEKLPTHEKFLSDQLKMSIWIRLMPNENTVCIFSPNCTLQSWHCMQFFIPKYFSIFKEKPLTKEEISFLETLTFKMNGNYISKLTDLTNSDSFRSYLLKGQLEAFEKKLFERKVESARRNLTVLEETMNRAMDEYRQACEKRIEAMALVDGLKTMADQIDEHTELQDYLINNPRICNVSLSDSKISYIVKTYLAPHHIDEWDVISKYKQSFDQYINSNFTNRDDIKLLLDAIFSEDRNLKVRMCAYFSLDYFGSTATSQIDYNFAAANKELANYIPNPHLHYHNCFGQNKEAILEQLKNGDAIGAIECSIACTQRINIHERASFRPFVQNLLNTEGKCIVAEDGTEMTPKEAVAYLKGSNNV